MPARLRWSSRASPIWPVGRGQQPSYRLVEVPVRAEQVRAEVPDRVALLAALEQLDDRQPEADGLPFAVLEHHPHLVAGPAPPPLAGPVEVPRPVHLEVRVQGQVGADPGQQVLAAADHLLHGLAGQVHGGQLGHPEVGPGQGAAGQRVVHAPRRQPDRVTLGHVTMLSRSGGMKRAGRALKRR